MNGACWAFAAGPTVEVDGTRLLVRGRTISDYAIFEAEIRRERGCPHDLIRRAMRAMGGSRSRQEELAAWLVDEQLPRLLAVTRQDLLAWLRTSRGRAFALWLSIRENDPRRWTLERVLRHAGGAAGRTWIAALNAASADDEQCAAFWPGLGGEWEAELPHWPSLIRRLAEAYQMSPREIGTLTLQQLRFLMWEQPQLAEQVAFDRREAFLMWRERRAEERRRLVEWLIA